MLEEKSFSVEYIDETISLLKEINIKQVEGVVRQVKRVINTDGRIFFVGVGGGAAHASHAVNDFRKLAGIESYCVTDNVSELTARVNDDCWENSYVEYIKVSKPTRNDLVFVFSVGGGDKKKNVSNNIVNLLEYIKYNTQTKIVGIVGPNGGYTSDVANACVVMPNMQKNITPHTEGLQSVISHLIVTHPDICKNKTTW